MDQAKAALAASEAALEDNQPSKRIQDVQIEAANAGVVRALTAINAAKVAIASVSPEFARADTELHRLRALIDKKAATHQQLKAATAQEGQLSGKFEVRKADLARVTEALATSQSELEAAERQREALNTKEDVYKADIKAKKAAIVVAQVNQAYTRIAAPTDGTVGVRHAVTGQLVAPGTQMFDLVQSDVWVQVNFKETQLTNMRIGDSADVRIDTFPNRVFQGKVDQPSPASGSQFALFPPDNSTGNFTSVVLRVPIRTVIPQGSPLPNGFGPDSQQLLSFIPSRLGPDRTVINDRS
jgi:membrane fusion protein (multidrug efflux system)